MRSFKDANGREWRIVVNVRTAKAVKDMAGINLFALFSDEANRLFGDPISLVNVLYVLCAEQCQAKTISEADFAEALFGDAIEQAANALLEEVRDFFPSSRRKLIQATIDKAKELQTGAESRILEDLAKLDPMPSSKRSIKSRAP